MTRRSAWQKENRSPKPRSAQESREEKSHDAQSSSSPSSGPLQDTWKLLELGSSPSGLTSQDDSAPGRQGPGCRAHESRLQGPGHARLGDCHWHNPEAERRADMAPGGQSFQGGRRQGDGG